MLMTNTRHWRMMARDDRAAVIVEAFGKIGRGQTARTVAEKVSEIMGELVTRNSIIGFLARNPGIIKLTGEHPSNIRRRAPPKPKPPRPVVVKVVKPPKPPKPEPEPVVVIEIECDPVRLVDLPKRACKWPVSGEGYDMMFCARTTDGHMWCGHHRKLGYQK